MYVWLHSLCITSKMGLFPGGYQVKDTTQSKFKRRKDLLFAASKENIRDLPQSRVSLNSKTGSFKVKIHAFSWRGFGGPHSLSFINWGIEKINIINLWVSVDLVVECFRLIFTIETELGVFPSDICYGYFSCLIIGNVSAFFYSLRILTKTCSRTGIMARLRSQCSLGPKCLLCLESHP